MKLSAQKHLMDERHALKLRVRKVTGQLNAIERMLDEDRDCTEILNQIVSSRKALKSLAEKLIHSHTLHCIENAQSRAEGRKQLQELLVVLERYVE